MSEVARATRFYANRTGEPLSLPVPLLPIKMQSTVQKRNRLFCIRVACGLRRVTQVRERSAGGFLQAIEKFIEVRPLFVFCFHVQIRTHQRRAQDEKAVREIKKRWEPVAWWRWERFRGTYRDAPKRWGEEYGAAGKHRRRPVEDGEQ